MLQFVRSKQKSVLIKIAFGAIILSFVIGYTMLTSPTDQRPNRGGKVAASVNGDEIDYASFQRAYSALYNLYQSIYQGNFNSTLEKQLNLPKQAMQQLIDEALLVQQADTLGLEVTKQELVDSIAHYEAFQVDGKFNRDRYIETLNYQRISPEQFEATQRRQLLTQKVRTRLQEGASVSEEELKAAFHQQNDKVNLNFAWVTPALVEAKVKVTDEDLQNYFEKNKEAFRVPEKVSLRYLQFDPARYENAIETLTEQELQRYYRRNLDQFEIKESVKAAHILVQVPSDAKEETVEKRKALAEDILKQLKNGADFAQLAKKYSDDKSNAAKGGELGSFGRGAMVPEFEKAAFALHPGQLSDVIRTPFGFHIIKVEAHNDDSIKPLVDVIADVKKGLRREKARQLAYEKAMDAYNINRKTGDLDSAAKANDLGIKETGFFTSQEPIDGIGMVKEINQAAFTLKEGELAHPIQTTQGVFLITIKERKASHIPTLAEVKPQVERAYRAEQAQTLAKELAEKLLNTAEKKKSLIAAAKELKLTVEETGDFSHSYGYFIPKIGTSKELVDAAFTLTPAAPVAPKVYVIDNKYLVASLKKATPADFDKLGKAELTQLKNRLLSEKKDKIVREKIQQLEQQAQIEIMVPELANAFNSGEK